MRKQSWLLGCGIAGAGLMLAVLGQRGWGQTDQLPGLRPPTPPAPSALGKELDKPTRPSAGDSVTLPPLPVEPAPPPPILPVPEPGAPSRRAAPETGDLLAPRREPAPAVSLLPAPAVSSLPAPTISPLQEIPPAGKQESAVTVEWVGGAAAHLNQPFACQILVRNIGATPVHQVTVRHRLNPSVTCKRTEPAATTQGDELIWSIGTLQPGQQRRLDLHLVCSQRGAVNCHATATFATNAGQQIQVREPLLAVKMRAPEKGIAGEKFNLVFAVANPGDGAAEHVQVKAELPDGLETGRSRVVTLDVGNLAPRENRTFQIPCTIVGQGKHTCRIVASAAGNLTATDQSETEILEPRLDLALNGPKLRYLDRHTVYQVKVTNTGSAPATGVVVNEVVPAGFKFHGATGGGRWEEATRTVHWQLGEVPPGQSREVTVDLIAAGAGDHRLLARAVSSQGGKADASASTRIEGTSALVIELLDLDDPVEVGGETVYEIRVINAGTKMETNLEVACTLPEQVELIAAKSMAGIQHRLQGRELVFDPLPRLAPKADVIYRVTVRGLQAGDMRFRTRIRADGLPEPVLREESTRFYNDK
jgi:hypothetical protein